MTNTRVGSHVIEPIGQIIARQATVRQDNLPNEDAQSLVFDDTNLFEVTKFSGYDRIETGTRANVGLQYTFQSNDGGYARILAGESFHLAGDNPYQHPGHRRVRQPDVHAIQRPAERPLRLRARRLRRAVELHAAASRRRASIRTASTSAAPMPAAS